MSGPETVNDTTQTIHLKPSVDRPYGQAYREPGPAGQETVASPGQRSAQQTPGGFTPYPDASQGRMEYGQPQPAGPRAETFGIRALWILAFVFSAVALLVPFVGFAAIACGAVAWGKGSSRGKLATFVAIGATVLGWVISVVIYTS